jgi:hypothetical protein
LSAPYADDEIHRHEHQLPHHEKEQQVERHEDAQHPRGEYEEERAVAVQFLPNARPAAENDERHQERRQEDQHHRNAVYAERQPRAPERNPRDVDIRLPRRGVRVHGPPEAGREDELDDEVRERHHLHLARDTRRRVALRPRREPPVQQDPRRARDRQQEQDRKDPVVVADGAQEGIHVVSMLNGSR